MYSLSDGGYCHGEKKALFSTSSPRFFFLLAAISFDSAKLCFLYTS